MSLLDGIDAVVFDVDGTLLHSHDPGGVRGARPIAGAVEAVARVRASRATAPLLHERHGPAHLPSTPPICAPSASSSPTTSS